MARSRGAAQAWSSRAVISALQAAPGSPKRSRCRSRAAAMRAATVADDSLP